MASVTAAPSISHSIPFTLIAHRCRKFPEQPHRRGCAPSRIATGTPLFSWVLQGNTPFSLPYSSRMSSPSVWERTDHERSQTEAPLASAGRHICGGNEEGRRPQGQEPGAGGHPQQPSTDLHQTVARIQTNYSCILAIRIRGVLFPVNVNHPLTASMNNSKVFFMNSESVGAASLAQSPRPLVRSRDPEGGRRALLQGEKTITDSCAGLERNLSLEHEIVLYSHYTFYLWKYIFFNFTGIQTRLRRLCLDALGTNPHGTGRIQRETKWFSLCLEQLLLLRVFTKAFNYNMSQAVAHPWGTQTFSLILFHENVLKK